MLNKGQNRLRARVARKPVCIGIAILAAAVSAWAFVDRLEDALYIEPDGPAIEYDQTPPNDPVGKLERKLESGQVKLDYAANGWGYLPALLKALNVPVDSQVLVFSKGSIQAEHINPRTPRAIYFNDDVAVGYVQGGDALEMTGLDPVRGIYLYSLDTPKTDKPEFGRRPDCMRCHEGPPTLAIPGLIVSSVHPSSGERESHGSSFITDGRVPISERWGGWYITGSLGAQQTSYANDIALVDPLHPGEALKEIPANLTTLSSLFDTSRYLAPTSDVVALMTLEHQVRMTNLLIRVGWDARIALQEGKWDDAQMNSEVQELVTYMLFADEASFKGGISGGSSFAKTFAARGPQDRQGRSLRDFDLQTRLFRYPVSYMLYSAAFDNLPEKLRGLIYRRIYDTLSGKDPAIKLDRIAAQDRQAALEIVRETKPNLPAYWSR